MTDVRLTFYRCFSDVVTAAVLRLPGLVSQHMEAYMRRSLLAVVVLGMLLVVPAYAQVSIGIGGQYLGLGGNDFEGTDGGLGAEARIMFPVGKSVSLGGGLQYSAHNSDFFDNSIKILGILAEGRYMFQTASGKATPYLAGRGGWAKASTSDVDIDGDGIVDINDLSQSGMVFGAGGGVLVSMSPTASLDLGLVFHTVSFGDADADGTTITNSDVSGTGIQLRVGVSFKLGTAK